MAFNLVRSENIVRFQKKSRPTPRRRERGVLKVKILEAKYEAKLEFPGRGGGGRKQNTFHRRVGIFSGTAHCTRHPHVLFWLLQAQFSRKKGQHFESAKKGKKDTLQPKKKEGNKQTTTTTTTKKKFLTMRCSLIKSKATYKNSQRDHFYPNKKLI